MTLGERIKEARKSSGMTQQELADATGLKRNTIATYEIERTSPSDRTIRDIAKATGVSELWLRMEEGEMQAPKSRAQELAEFVAGLSGEWSEQKRRIVRAICSVDDPAFWKTCADLIDKLAQKDGRE